MQCLYLQECVTVRVQFVCVWYNYPCELQWYGANHSHPRHSRVAVEILVGLLRPTEQPQAKEPDFMLLKWNNKGFMLLFLTPSLHQWRLQQIRARQIRKKNSYIEIWFLKETQISSSIVKTSYPPLAGRDRKAKVNIALYEDQKTLKHCFLVRCQKLSADGQNRTGNGLLERSMIDW